MRAELAFVFPGQGAQSVGMLVELAQKFPVVSEVFDEAADVLKLDLWALCRDGPEQELNHTVNTQPALLSAGYAVWRVWRQCNGTAPTLLAGHSLGEYTALVCAGALRFRDAIRLVAERGRLMQEAAPPGVGAMLAIIGLDDARVTALCATATTAAEQVTPANFNSPGQVVIAGKAAAVRRAGQLAEQAGARRVVPLSVSVPSHCPLMLPAARQLERQIAELELTRAALPVVQNVDARARHEPQEIKQALVSQLHQPVLWTQSIIAMRDQGVARLVECGPGKTLCGLARRIDKTMRCHPAADPAALDSALEACMST